MTTLKLALFLFSAALAAPSVVLAQSTTGALGGTSGASVAAPFPAVDSELKRDRVIAEPAFGDPDRSDVIDLQPNPSVAASAFASPGDLNAVAVGMSQESYLSREAPAGRSDGFQLISARLRTRARTANPYFFSYLEIGGGFSTNVENMSYLMVPEAYLRWASEPTLADERPSGFTGRAPAPGLSLLIGRAKEKWSRLDEQWGLGLWQPLFRWDWVRPEAQGLAGAFVAMESDRARLVLFGTPVFIPEQGPPFQLVDGKFNSSSPWFNGPPDGVVMFSRVDEMRYSLRTPPVGTVISHGAAGAMAQLGNPASEGLWAQASYAYKPRNQLDLAFDAYVDNMMGPTATIYPDVAYHHLIGFDVGGRSGPISAWLSLLREIPINDDRPAFLTYERLSPMTAASPTLEAKLPFAPRWRPRIAVSYLHREGGGGVDANAMSSQNGSAFGPRFPYAEAASVGLRATTQIAHGRILDLGFKGIQEFSEMGTILSLDARFQPAPAWTLTGGIDLLASDRADEDASTMIARDRGNDRAFVGAAYAF